MAYDGMKLNPIGDPDTEHLRLYPCTIKEVYPLLRGMGKAIAMGTGTPLFDRTKLMSRMWQLQYEEQVAEGKIRSAWDDIEPPTWEDRLEWSIEANRWEFQQWLNHRVNTVLNADKHPLWMLNKLRDTGWIFYEPNK